ncbi:MAG: ABC transporter substrate-binding protein [Mumia sp.]|nr:ABC transporter substrate-binding protein [Mumia sp.]
MRLSRRTRLGGVALLAAIGLTLSGCGGDGGDEGNGSSDSTDAVITARSTEPQNPLVPQATNEVGGGNVIDLLYAGLITYKEDGSQELEVAESITSDDNKTWTIKLKDWKFSDGTAVTAKSFVDAWNYGAGPGGKNAQNASYFYYPIEGTTAEGTLDKNAQTISGLKVVDDKTFTITLKQPESDFPLRLGYSAYYPLPESAFADIKAYGEKPVGNGPYKLEAWENNKEIRLVPNGEYDGARKAQNGGVTFVVYTDTEAAYTDLQSGNLDVLDTVPDSALATFADDSAIQPIEAPGSVNGSFQFPVDLPGFTGEAGKLRRQAVSMALNREELTEKLFFGTRTPALDFSAPTMPGWTDEIPGNEVLEFNADEAKKRWAEAEKIEPWGNKKLLIATNTDGAGNKASVDAMANQIKNTLGIKAEPKYYATFDEFLDDRDNNKTGALFRAGWQPDYASISNYLGPIYGTGAASNDARWSNKEFDALIAKAAGAETDEDRYQAFVDAQAILMEELPGLSMWYTDATGAAAKGVKNVKFNWQGVPIYQNITK